MGLGLTNIQLFVGDRDPLQIQAQAVEALQKSLADRYFVTVPLNGNEVIQTLQNDTGNHSAYQEAENSNSASPTFERGATIGFNPTSGSRWVTLYDQLLGKAGETELKSLCAQLSQQLQTFVVSIQIFSDTFFEMRLFADGRQVDVYDKGYYECTDPQERESRIGHAELWQSVLVPGATIEQLRIAWDEDYWAGADNLRLVIPLMGLDKALAFGDWHEELPEDLAGLNFRWLAFRSERPPLARVIGKPLFNGQFKQPTVPQFEEGTGELNYLYSQFENRGGAGQGLEIMVWGSLLDAGLLELEAVEVVCWWNRKLVKTDNGETSWQLVREAQKVRLNLEEQISQNNIRVWLAVALEFQLVGALVNGSSLEHPHYNSSEIMVAQDASRILVYPKGRLVKVGQGELNVAVRALEATETTQEWAVQSKEVAVIPKVVPPIKVAEAAKQVTPQAVQRLTSEDKLCVIVLLDTDKVANAPFLAEAIEEWMRVAPTHDQRQSGNLLLQVEQIRRPQKHPFELNSSSDGSNIWGKWQQLRQYLPTCEMLSGEVGQEDALNPYQELNKGYGFAYRLNSPHRYDTSGQATVPSLVLWKDFAGLPPQSRGEVEAVLRELLDKLMLNTNGLQAAVANWNWTMTPEPYVYQTPYESVKEFQNNLLSTTLGWNSRWLRAVSKRLWLGENLATRLKLWLEESDNRQSQLARVAVNENLGTILRLELKPTAKGDLHELEQLLDAAGLVAHKADYDAMLADYYNLKPLSAQ
jgi:hypothetical protein